MQSVEARVLKLEQSMRSWKRTAVVSLVMLVGIAALGAQPLPTYIPEVMHARRFDVVNEKGTVVASIGIVRGNGSVALYNTEGKLQLLAAGSTDGGDLSLCDGERQVVFAGSASDGGTIRVYDQRGQLNFARNG